MTTSRKGEKHDLLRFNALIFDEATDQQEQHWEAARKFMSLKYVKFEVTTKLSLTKDIAIKLHQKYRELQVRKFHANGSIPKITFYDIIVFSAGDYEAAIKYHDEHLDTVIFVIKDYSLNDEAKERFKVCSWEFMTEYIKSLVSKYKDSKKNANGQSKVDNNAVSPEESKVSEQHTTDAGDVHDD